MYWHWHFLDVKIRHFKNAKFSRTPIKLHLMLTICIHVYLKERPGLFIFYFCGPANCFYRFNTAACFCWYWKNNATVEMWNQTFCLLWITAIDLCRRTNFFIYCFLCLCPFLGFIFASFVHSFHSKTQSMVKGKWSIFLQFLMVDALSQCHPLEKSFQKKSVLLSQYKWKIKLFSIQQSIVFPPRGQCYSILKLKHSCFPLRSTQTVYD